ncbi:Hypothetical predicted protein [Podarcis lilfordi]|uniref:Uncharacterized protein n=1 Tax=Podarcis lilfordi TaxID=74358 RepID=A0AA35KD74_9SAUR|nr:Hypothetical predicted protein [Podarcis lilfordi]
MPTSTKRREAAPRLYLVISRRNKLSHHAGSLRLGHRTAPTLAPFTAKNSRQSEGAGKGRLEGPRLRGTSARMCDAHAPSAEALAACAQPGREGAARHHWLRLRARAHVCWEGGGGREGECGSFGSAHATGAEVPSKRGRTCQPCSSPAGLRVSAAWLRGGGGEGGRRKAVPQFASNQRVHCVHRAGQQCVNNQPWESPPPPCAAPSAPLRARLPPPPPPVLPPPPSPVEVLSAEQQRRARLASPRRLACLPPARNSRAASSGRSRCAARGKGSKMSNSKKKQRLGIVTP